MPTPPQRRPDPTPAQQTDQPLILLAIPNLSVRAMGSTALRKAGFRVTEATSGHDALTAVERLRPDLVLTDLVLEGLDALQLVTAIREIPECKTTPVFVISGLVHSELIQKVFTLGRTDFISLPINWLVLVHRIRQAVALRRLLQRLEEKSIDLVEAREMALSASQEALLLKNYDRLTGLPNRTMFLDSVGLAMNQNERRGHELALLLVDIDGFKSTNDSLGRSGGDQLLQVISTRLQSCLRSTDFLGRHDEPGSEPLDDKSKISMARLGGDEFAIFIGKLDGRKGALKVVERVLDAFRTPYNAGGQEHFLSASVGVAMDDDTTCSEEVLIERAETAMRHAKRKTGSSYAFYEISMRNHAVRRLEVKNDFMRAIEKGQLFLRYQPIVDAEHGKIVGVEGLLRWRHPERGLVSPEEFIPVAEETGLATKIGDWVLREGCRQARKWETAGHGLTVSLNVSNEQLTDKTIVDSVRAAIEETGVSPALLQLELSERGALRADPEVTTQLLALRELGVTLAIDDFGIGQTALSYLGTLPVQVVKIDRSFIQGITRDEASASITAAIVAMSHRLGLKVVAEGVERVEQAEFLRGTECDEIQGFLYSTPIAARELEVLLEGGPSIRRPESEPPVDLSEPIPEDADLVDEEEHERILRLAHRDFLTDLLNRYAFEERLELAFAQASRFGQPVALLLIDLDRFKQINDSHGHQVGDRLLVEVAERLGRCVRRVDALARLGGDEFAIIHTGFKDLDGVAHLARRVLAVINAPMQIDERRIQISPSVGIAILDGSQTELKQFVQQADLALYKAKDEGRNCFRFHAQEMEDRVLRRLAIGRELKGALDREELFLEYQPQMDLESGAITAAEVLLRWQSPERGRVDPTEFIPVAETSGEILPIGEWVLRKACGEARRLQESTGCELSIAVNLSVVQFSSPSFPAIVDRVLTETGLDPRRLELEVSEQLLGRATPAAEDALRRLHDCGVRFSMDNFGRDATSMDCFRRLPFSKVKIDGSLVAGADGSDARDGMAGAIVTMARRLGLEVVAEGIERLDQVEAMLDEGCRYGQGFYLGHPMPGDELEAMILRWRDVSRLPFSPRAAGASTQ